MSLNSPSRSKTIKSASTNKRSFKPVDTKIRWHRLPAILLAAILTLASVLLVGIPSAHGATPSETTETNPGISGLEVSIASLTPLNPQPKKRLKVTGTVTNRTNTPINSISIRLLLGQSPITSEQAVADIDSNTSIASARELPNGQLTKDLTGSGGLAPQATTDFSFDIPFKNIAIPNSGIYAVRVEAVDFANSSNSGYTQTFLPWYPATGTYAPINVLLYWPLAAIPNKTATDLLMDDMTPISLDIGGRLQQILNTPGAKQQATWVVDSSLIQTAAAASNGYEYLNSENQSIKGTRAPAVAKWLAEAKQLLQGAQVKAMPYANSDTSSLISFNLKTDAAQAIHTAASTLSADLGIPVTETLTWVPTSRISAAAVDLSTKSGAAVTVLSSSAIAGDSSSSEYGRSRNPVNQIATPNGLQTALVADPALSQAFAQEAPTAVARVKLRQRILALIGSWPNSQEVTSLVVAPPTTWSPDTRVLAEVLQVLKDAKWVHTTTQEAILKAHEPAAELQLNEPTSSETTTPRTARYFRSIAKAQQRLVPFEAVLGNPSEFTNPVQSALLRAESALWRGNRTAARSFVRTINSQITDATSQVRAVASNIVSLSSEDGTIPITLINDFDQPATVKVRLDADPSIRLTSQITQDYKIPARRKISIEIPIKVAGSEDLPVKIQLLTPTGQTWGIGDEISVRSSAYARAATWVVVAAFVVLSGLLILNSIRRRKATKAAAAKNIHDLSDWRQNRD